MWDRSLVNYDSRSPLRVLSDSVSLVVTVREDTECSTARLTGKHVLLYVRYTLHVLV